MNLVQCNTMWMRTPMEGWMGLSHWEADTDANFSTLMLGANLHDSNTALKTATSDR